MLFLCLVRAILSSGSAIFRPPPDKLPERCSERLSIYQVAELVTGAPSDILRGIDFAESSCGKRLKHSNPNDKGRFGLHESPAIRAERIRKWGYYDPHNPGDAAIIAGHIYMEHLARFGDESLAIAAYHQGTRGIMRYGADAEYIMRVRGIR